MRVVLVSGALGSGKTTLLLPLAEALQEAGHHVGILENDAGQVPVDAPFLRSQGFAVQDLASGCICCDLSSELPGAFAALSEALDPDVVLIEPSGLAAPGILKNALTGILKPEDEFTGLYLLDLVEYDHRGRSLSPFHQRAAETADILVPTKESQVSLGVMTALSEEIDTIDSAPIRMLPEQVVKVLTSTGGSFGKQDSDSVYRKALSTGGDIVLSLPMNIFAAQYGLNWNPLTDGTASIRILSHMLEQIRNKVRSTPGSDIGTLKISSEDHGGVMLAVSDEISPVRSRGDVRNPPDTIAVNLLVRGGSFSWDDEIRLIVSDIPQLEGISSQ